MTSDARVHALDFALTYINVYRPSTEAQHVVDVAKVFEKYLNYSDFEAPQGVVAEYADASAQKVVENTEPPDELVAGIFDRLMTGKHEDYERVRTAVMHLTSGLRRIANHGETDEATEAERALRDATSAVYKA